MKYTIFIVIICINCISAFVNKKIWQSKQNSIKFTNSLIQKQIHAKHMIKYGKPAAYLNSFPDYYLEQNLDHFDHLLKKTYLQRYWVNDEFFVNKTNGPVFLYIGGEGAESPLRVQGGEHYELARKYNALIFVVEHRFYGKSLNSDGLKLENLRYLSSQQALADLANFHVFSSKKYSLTSANPWICFGGSYPGSLSAWFRIKYPQLVYGAVSSSSPVHAIVNFEGYHDTTAAALADPIVGGSVQCADRVKQAFKQIDLLISTNKLKQIEKDFMSCEPLSKSSGDVESFAGNVAGIFDGIIQYNNEKDGSPNVSTLCNIMNQNGSAYSKLMQINKVTLTSSGEKCTDNSWKSFISMISNDTISVSSEMPGMRQWIYQTCTQFGYYQTCDPTSKCIFSKYITLKPNLDLCKQVFEMSAKEVYDSVEFTNAFYGSDKPRGSRIVFVNGSIDPWHSLSVLRNLQDNESAIYINGTAHCANMHASLSTDPKYLVDARLKVDDQISEWITKHRTLD